MWCILIIFFFLLQCESFILHNSARRLELDGIFLNKFSRFSLFAKKSGSKSKSNQNKKQSSKDLNVLHIEGEWEYWKLDDIVKNLENGEVGVIPTDSCYSFVTSINQSVGVNKLLKLKGGSGHKKPLTLLCKDLSQISKYTEQYDSKLTYKLLKKSLPGPFTFVLPASKEVPKIVMNERIHPKKWRRTEIGVRIPADGVCQEILNLLSTPLLSGSVPGHPEDWLDLDLNLLSHVFTEDIDIDQVKNENDEIDIENENKSYIDIMETEWVNSVDFVVENGLRSAANGEDLTTVVDLTAGAEELRIIRQGSGVLPHV